MTCAASDAHLLGIVWGLPRQPPHSPAEPPPKTWRVAVQKLLDPRPRDNGSQCPALTGEVRSGRFGGYSLTRLDDLPWLAERWLRYWGNIDTHGFAILDRLRRKFPHARSILMDRTTLLAQEDQWVRERSPVSVPLDRLMTDESALDHDLVEDTFGPAVRLEQERIRLGVITEALRD